MTRIVQPDALPALSSNRQTLTALAAMASSPSASLLAARYWVVTYIVWIARALAVLGVSRQADIARDWALNRMAKRLKQPEIIWDDLIDTPVAQKLKKPETGKSADGLQAAE